MIWLQGEHDISTDAALAATLASAIELGSEAVVLDLSDVQFISVSTIDVILRARQVLYQRSRSLTVRSPSPFARRVIEVCGLNDLIGPGPGDPDGVVEPAAAFGPWVKVPATHGADGQPARPSPAPTYLG